MDSQQDPRLRAEQDKNTQKNKINFAENRGIQGIGVHNVGISVPALICP